MKAPTATFGGGGQGHPKLRVLAKIGKLGGGAIHPFAARHVTRYQDEQQSLARPSASIGGGGTGPQVARHVGSQFAGGMRHPEAERHAAAARQAVLPRSSPHCCALRLPLTSSPGFSRVCWP